MIYKDIKSVIRPGLSCEASTGGSQVDRVLLNGVAVLVTGYDGAYTAVVPGT